MKPKPMPMEFLARPLPEHRVTESGCWVLENKPGAGGYANLYMRIEGRFVRMPAHRVFFERLAGPIPDGLTLDHLCRVRRCVNPEHLEPVTMRENLMRGQTLARINAAKVVCNAGHPLDGANVYLARGRRICRQCGRDWYREHLAPVRKARRLACRTL